MDTSLSVGRCYRLLSGAAFACAGGTLVLQALGDLAAGRSLNGTNWLRLAVPATILTVVYAVAARWARRAEILYAAAVTGVLAVGLFVDRGLHTVGAGAAYRLAHDLLAFGVVAHTGSALWYRWATRARTDAPAAWFAPLYAAGVVSVAATLILVASGYEEWGVCAGFWAAVGLAAATSLAVGSWSARTVSPAFAVLPIGEGLAGIAVMSGFGAYALGATASAARRWAAAALVAYSWVAITAAHYLKRPTAPSPTVGPEGAPDGSQGEDVASRIPGPDVFAECWMPALRAVGTVALAFVLPLASAGGTVGAAADELILAGGAVLLAAGGNIRPQVDMLSLGASAALLTLAWLLRTVSQSADMSASGVVVAGCILCATAYAVAALRGWPCFGWGAALAGSAAWYGLTVWLVHVRPSWASLSQTPWLALLYWAGVRLAVTNRPEFGYAARVTAVCLALACEVALLAQQTLVRASIWYAPSTTVAAFGLLGLARMFYRADRKWAAFALGHLWVALWVYVETARRPAPDIVVVLGAAALGGVIAGWLLSQSARTAQATTGAYDVAALAALVTFTYALLAVGEPGAGERGILAMALSGTVWAALYVLGRGAWYAHAAFGAYFAAYAVFVYDRASLNVGVLDLYLIPVGLYLLLLGHVAAARARYDDAIGLWWVGLLLVLGPTYAAFYVHSTAMGTPAHAILLVAESIAAVLWGISNRIRAFVITGTLFALGFAAVLVMSAIAQVWVGIVALITGLALLGAVYWLSTRHTAARAAIERALREWERWR